MIGLEFTAAAHSHLHQHRGDGREQGNQQHADKSKTVAPPAKEEGEIGEHADRAGDGRGDRHCQRVVVLHMGEFMRQNASARK